MKEYYIYDSEFRELKKVGGGAAVLFAIGSAAIGFAVNTHLGLIFADHLAAELKVQWETLRDIAVIIGIACYAFGVIQSLIGYNLVERIKAETQHGNQKYKPKSRYKIALWALVFVIFFALGGTIVWFLK